MNELIAHLPDGYTLDHYQIDSVLGEGGFGITYKAYDAQLQQWVAIKEYLPREMAGRTVDSITVQPRKNASSDYQFGLDRFLEEARTLAKFRHPNIVRVTRFLESNGTAYLIMDYEEGHSLSEWLKLHPGPVSEEQLKAWFVPIIRGLNEVHANDFLHRDIKPGNIYLRSRGEPVLIDFGAARQAIGVHSRSITGIVSPGYAPTEQYGTDASKQGPWTDLYSIGATLYRCISEVDASSGGVPEPVDAPTRQSAIMEEDEDPLMPAMQVGRGKYSDSFLQLIDRLLIIPGKKRPHSAGWVLNVLQGETTAAPVEVEEPRSTLKTRNVSSEEKVRPVDLESKELGRASAGGGAKRISVARSLLLLLVAGAVLIYWGYRELYSASDTSEPIPAVVEVIPQQPDVETDSEPPGVPNQDVLTPLQEPESQIVETPEMGTLSLFSKPAGASVYINDVIHEHATPMEVSLPFGDYRLRVQKEGFVSSSLEVSLSDRSMLMRTVELVPEPPPVGHLRIDVKPEAARITLLNVKPKYEDGIELPEGLIKYRVSHPGYASSEGSIRIVPGELSEVVVVLEPDMENVKQQFRQILAEARAQQSVIESTKRGMDAALLDANTSLEILKGGDWSHREIGGTTPYQMAEILSGKSDKLQARVYLIQKNCAEKVEFLESTVQGLEEGGVLGQQRLSMTEADLQRLSCIDELLTGASDNKSAFYWLKNARSILYSINTTCMTTEIDTSYEVEDYDRFKREYAPIFDRCSSQAKAGGQRLEESSKLYESFLK